MRSSNKTPGLPFPVPHHATIWPNGLGFDLGTLEFWQSGGGVRDLDTLTYGVGTNWVTALRDLLDNPKDCE